MNSSCFPRKSWLGYLCRVAALALLLGAAACDRGSGRKGLESTRGKRPNVILILIDTLRADGLGIYGNPHDNTPTMDAIAREGVLFRHAEAPAPWTQPSMASIFSGVYPRVHGVLDFQLALRSSRGAPKVAVFNSSFTTLAEVFHANGYATAGFVANPFLLSDYGFAQGFDHYDASFAKITTPGNIVNRAALDWLRQRDTRKPFFLYLHYMDVHGPYNPSPKTFAPLLEEFERLPNKTLLPAREQRRVEATQRMPPGEQLKTFQPSLVKYREYWVARYEAAIREMDHHLAGLRSALKAMGLWDDAYVVVTADHGEAFDEHGFWEHGFSLHETDLHVPLILRWKGALAAGTQVEATVTTLDLMPTFMDQLGFGRPEETQGVSLVPYIDGSPSAPPPHAFAEGVKFGARQRAVYSGSWKMILTLKSGRTELYNVHKDPDENRDLAAADASELKRMAQLLQTQVATNEELASGRVAESVKLSPEQQERLRALGYGN